MNFGTVNRRQCENLPPPIDSRCADPAFALANPATCAAQPRLVLKPDIGIVCLYGSVQMKAFLVDSAGETDVTDQTIFSSSNSGIIVVGAISGNANATGISGGNASITASYQGRTAVAEVTVMPNADCCTEQSVALVVMVDTSKSMSQAFNGSYATKLVFAKSAATRIIGEINSGKDKIGLIQFNDNSTDVLSDPISAKLTVKAMVAGISQTDQSTSFFNALTSAVATLAAVTADRKVIILISDGQDQAGTYLTENPIAVTEDFKAAGGIIMGLGVRAAGSGFSLLSLISTGGFFVNAYAATASNSLDYISGMKGYVCAGNCTPAGDVTVPTPMLNFQQMTNWSIIAGTINLVGPGLFDVLPGNGLYLAMDSTDCEIQTRNTFNFVAGKTYRIRVNVAGNQKVPASSKVKITIGSGFTTEILVSDYSQDFNNYSFNFTPTSSFSSVINIATTINTSGVEWGVLIDAITLDNVTDITSMFSDSFDNENPKYIPPACGWGTTLVQGTNAIVVAGAGDAINGTYTWDAETERYVLGGFYVYYDPAYRGGVWVLTIGSSYTYYALTLTGTWFSSGGEDGGTPPAPTVTYVGSPSYEYGTSPICDVVGCLSEPPPAQSPDPSALPDIEAGFTPPTVFNSTKTACVSCPVGTVNAPVGDLIPNMTSNTAPSGIASASSEPYSQYPAWKAFDGLIAVSSIPDAGAYQSFWVSDFINPAQSPYSPLPQWLQYKFDTAKSVNGYSISATSKDLAPVSWTLQASNDGSSWTDLDTQTSVSWYSFETKTFTITNTLSFLYYRILITAAGSSNQIAISEFNLLSTAPDQVCIEQSASSTVSQADADAKALAAATLAAQSQLNCVTQYTSTETYTATCPDFYYGPPITRSATETSLISQADADAKALAAAQAAAEAARDCTMSNNEQTIAISSTGPAAPYPSVKAVSGLSGLITGVTVDLKKLSHTFPDDLLIALRSPAGTTIWLMANCGGAFGFSNIDLTFNDSGAALPDATAIASGTYKPTRFGPTSPLSAPAPSPSSGYGVTLASFIGENPNGSWCLFVYDDSPANSGQMLLGWDITIVSA